MKKLVLSAIAVIGLVTPAIAADELATAPYGSPAFSGYISVHGGFDSGSEAATYYDPGPFFFNDSWDGSVVGASARLAVRLSPSWSVQGDVWTNVFSSDGNVTDTGGPDYSYSSRNSYPGIGGHLTWHNGNGLMAGALASYGRNDDAGNMVNIALEAVHEAGNWRLYGQAGRAVGVSGFAELANSSVWYAHGVATYYYSPNLAISGNLGVASGTSDFPVATERKNVSWGARVEYKPESLPISTFVAYRGWHFSGSSDFPANWSGNEHAVVVGLRVLFNAGSVQQLNSEVGLYDMNPVFGEKFGL